MYYDLKRYQYILCYTFFDTHGNGFKLDLFDCNEYRGLVTNSFDDLYDSSILTQQSVRGSSELHNVVIIFIRSLLSVGIVKERYIPEILNYCSCNKLSVIDELSKLFNPSIAEAIVGKLCDNDVRSITNEKSRLRRILLLNNIKSRGLKTLTSYLNHYICTFKTRCAMRKSKCFISVMGADGAGKTTFLDALTLGLATIYSVHEIEDKCKVYHHRPTMFPNLGHVAQKAKIMEADTDFSRPHRAKPVGFLSSLVRMVYYWMDYLIGGVIILRKNAKNDRFTIFDRYIYDFLVDPYRSRINLPYWLRTTFTRLVPQPRIVFILTTDAEIIHRRKQELSIEEIERQNCELTKLAATSSRFVMLDASKSPNELAREALNVIIDRFTTKI